jgi:uncharacterized membrane protein
MHEGEMSPYVTGALLAGIGAGLFFVIRSQRGREHWTPAARMAIGAMGGSLVLLGIRAPGRIGRLAATTGAGIVVRSAMDRPIRSLADVVQPQKLFAL